MAAGHHQPQGCERTVHALLPPLPPNTSRHASASAITVVPRKHSEVQSGAKARANPSGFFVCYGVWGELDRKLIMRAPFSVSVGGLTAASKACGLHPAG